MENSEGSSGWRLIRASKIHLKEKKTIRHFHCSCGQPREREIEGSWSLSRFSLQASALNFYGLLVRMPAWVDTLRTTLKTIDHP